MASTFLPLDGLKRTEDVSETMISIIKQDQKTLQNDCNILYKYSMRQSVKKAIRVMGNTLFENWIPAWSFK